MSGGVGGDEAGAQQQPGMVIHCEQQGLLVLSGPPSVAGGVVLPEFAHAGALPAATGLGVGRRGVDQQGEVTAGVGGDRFAVTAEGEAGGEFGGGESVQVSFCSPPTGVSRAQSHTGRSSAYAHGRQRRIAILKLPFASCRDTVLETALRSGGPVGKLFQQIWHYTTVSALPTPSGPSATS